MHAVIMAGGAGSRLEMGEKPLVNIAGRPMILYIIEAFGNAGYEPVVAGSHNTPMTLNWCRTRGILSVKTTGTGYVADMIEAVRDLGDRGPLFVSVSDIPCLDSRCIKDIVRKYEQSGKEACSTWVPARLVRSCRESMPYRETIDRSEACPAGINILTGANIGQPQDELKIFTRNPLLALNVNTRADLAEAEAILSGHRSAGR